MTTPLSIVYILFWLAEMGLAVAAACACVGADADPCASTATGTAEKVANRKESLLVTGNAPWNEVTSCRGNRKPPRLRVRLGCTSLLPRKFNPCVRVAAKKRRRVARTSGAGRK